MELTPEKRAELRALIAKSELAYDEVVIAHALLDAAEERDRLLAKLDFLREKGITVGMMKTSDRPEPYFAYDIRSGSELDDTDTINRLTALEVENAKLRAEVELVLFDDGTTGTRADAWKREYEKARRERDDLREQVAKLREFVEATVCTCPRSRKWS